MSDVLAALIAEAQRNAEAGAAFPALPRPEPTLPSLVQSVRALIEAVEMMTGRRGTAATTAVFQGAFEEEIRRIEGLIP
jgi:hypothetical protein